MEPELFYLAIGADAAIMSVPVARGRTDEVSLDGRRFLMEGRRRRQFLGQHFVTVRNRAKLARSAEAPRLDQLTGPLHARHTFAREHEPNVNRT